MEKNTLTTSKINAIKQEVAEEWGYNQTVNEAVPAADESEDETIAWNDESGQKKEQMVLVNERIYVRHNRKPS